MAGVSTDYTEIGLIYQNIGKKGNIISSTDNCSSNPYFSLHLQYYHLKVFTLMADEHFSMTWSFPPKFSGGKK